MNKISIQILFGIVISVLIVKTYKENNNQENFCKKNVVYMYDKCNIANKKKETIMKCKEYFRLLPSNGYTYCAETLKMEKLELKLFKEYFETEIEIDYPYKTQKVQK